jgi:hypothetical protein
VALVIGAIECEVTEGSEVALDANEERGVGRDVGELDVVRGRPVADAAVLRRRQMRAEVVENDRDADLLRVEDAQVAAEREELGAVLRLLDVAVELVSVRSSAANRWRTPLVRRWLARMRRRRGDLVVPFFWRETTGVHCRPGLGIR